MIGRDARAAAVARYSSSSQDELEELLYNVTKEMAASFEVFAAALITGADTGPARAAMDEAKARQIDVHAALKARIAEGEKAERRRLESTAVAVATHALRRVNGRLTEFVMPVPPGGGA